MTASRTGIIILALLLASLTSACGPLLPEKTQYRLFTLPMPGMVAINPVSHAVSLRVETPEASPPLTGSRILVMPGPLELSVYAEARWNDSIPGMLSHHLIQSLREDGRIAEVIGDNIHARSDFTLLSQLGAFQIVHSRAGEPPEALIRLDARLIRSRSSHTVDSRRFEIRQPSTGSDIESVVTAMATGSDRLAAEVMAWLSQVLPEQP